MASKPIDFSVSIKPEEVMYTSINTSKDGYNSARMVMKAGEMMSFMKNSGVETSGVWKGKEEDYKEFSKIK